MAGLEGLQDLQRAGAGTDSPPSARLCVVLEVPVAVQRAMNVFQVARHAPKWLVSLLAWCICSAGLAGLVPVAFSHEVRPAYLELTQVGRDTYDVLWRVPAFGDDQRLAIHPEFSSDRAALTRSRGSIQNSALTERFTLTTPEGLAGSAIRIDGLTATMTDVLVRIQYSDGGAQIVRLTPRNPSFVVATRPRTMEVAGTYLRLGIEHILSGVDHLLFVLSLMLITAKTRQLVKAVTAFTAAHSLTLAAATLGFVHVPSKPVEATIALSIVFVAAEILRARRGKVGIAARLPWVVSFSFGLLHGFGFAGALSEVGIPEGHIPVALLFFNIGVELGQLLFVGAVVGFTSLLRRAGMVLPGWSVIIAPYAIGVVAMFWVIQRVSAF